MDMQKCTRNMTKKGFLIMMTNFKTRAEIGTITMPRVLGNNQYKRNFIVALDGGYSSVKGISENTIFCFPSYAKRVSSIDVTGRLNETDIVLTNHKTGEIWLVGAFAENTMNRSDIQSTTDENLYTRYRYKSDIYRAIMTAGLGIALFNTAPDENFHTLPDKNLNICLQTGLPSAYVKKDASNLREVLTGDYDFTLRIGTQDKHFVFTLNSESIGIMEQPRGTLANIVYDKEGHLIPKMKNILNANTIILDVGFGTEDIFSIRSGANIKDSHNTCPTYSDTAMKAVFEAAVGEINDEWDTEFKVFELQKFLKTGKVPVLDRELIATKEVEFISILEKYNRMLCDKSIRRLLEEYDYLSDYNYLVVTGGTGESRIKQINEMLCGLPNLTVLLGNEADPSISAIYSNARGYYMSMLLKVQKASKNMQAS